jgi:hypothetical protein
MFGWLKADTDFRELDTRNPRFAALFHNVFSGIEPNKTFRSNCYEALKKSYIKTYEHTFRQTRNTGVGKADLLKLHHSQTLDMVARFRTEAFVSNIITTEVAFFREQYKGQPGGSETVQNWMPGLITVGSTIFGYAPALAHGDPDVARGNTRLLLSEFEERFRYDTKTSSFFSLFLVDGLT